jgi:hypothetical protein
VPTQKKCSLTPNQNKSMEEYPESWNWTPRLKEVVVMTDHTLYRYYGGSPGQIGRRLVTKFGQDVDEEVGYYKGLGWLTLREKKCKDAKVLESKKRKGRP